MPRMYFPAWQSLKGSTENPKRIVIAAHGKLHRRIYKAIIKEKDMDLVYKLQLSENAQRARLSHESIHGRLVIFLHEGIGLSDFVLPDDTVKTDIDGMLT